MEYVTFDDQTIAQAARSYDYGWATALSATEAGWLIEKQRKVFCRAKMCCTPTHWAAQSLIDDYAIPPERVRVVGIGANHFARDDSARDWSSPRFLFVGYDWKRKNGPGVLAAFGELRREHPSATLDLVGGHPEIDMTGVISHGVLDPTRPEHQRALGALFGRATCFVMPSIHEPCGIAYVEASAAGIGSIGSKSGGSATLLGGGGIVVDPTESDELLEAMRTFCNPEAAAAYGAEASRRSELLTWQKVVVRLLAAFRGEARSDELSIGSRS